uniref:Uncharacterized protein n=1 Tax=Amblyomma maculatum TaxID=34609 RepID=G3MS54_AMBMU
MPAGRGSATERTRAANTEQQDEPHSGIWNCVILLHWCTGLSGFVYVIWRYANDKANTSLPNEMRQDFRPSPYGFGRKQDMASLDWQIERSFVLATWNWLLIHPLLARATAYAAPTLLPMFYTAYSALFVTALLGVEVAAVIVILHALFIIVASLRAPILCYAAALVVLLLKFSMSDSFRQLLYFRYGTLGYVVIMAIVQWTLLRCLSFSLDFIHAGCKARHQTAPGPPYWKTLALKTEA